MLKKSTMDFLYELSLNNNKAWFEKNKRAYESAKEDVEQLIETLIIRMSAFDEGLIGVNPQDCMFRIYKDARISKEKLPYKTNMGASIAPGGKKSGLAGYYIHIEPGGESFIAGGIWMPDKEPLYKIRQVIADHAWDFKKILNQRQFKIAFGLLEDHQGKTIPKEFSKGHPEADLLKYKSFIVSHAFDDKEVLAPDFIERVVEICRTLYPLNKFLNDAILDN
jgi:uncharacterized protein (TIGR02453 family)